MKATVKNNPIENLLDIMQEKHKMSKKEGAYLLVKDIIKELEEVGRLSKVLP